MSKAQTRRKKTGVRSRIWWALLNHPNDLPVLFRTRRDAVENREPDEYVVRVVVFAKSPRDDA